MSVSANTGIALVSMSVCHRIMHTSPGLHAAGRRERLNHRILLPGILDKYPPPSPPSLFFLVPFLLLITTPPPPPTPRHLPTYYSSYPLRPLLCIGTCSAHLSMFHMERRSKNALIVIIITTNCRSHLLSHQVRVYGRQANQALH